ncbi:MAG TPA: hypothetical protein VFN62_06095 [Acidobacteriaceae bacterium]|nr:hypothetical protein [Acidobacteriaceae bacterium]
MYSALNPMLNKAAVAATLHLAHPQSKEGLKVLYSASDPEIYRLLDIAKKIFNKQLVGVRNMLSQL